MAIEISDNLNPHQPEQLESGAFITQSDVSEVIKKTNAAMLEWKRVIAYSTGPVEVDTVMFPVYVFPVRVGDLFADAVVLNVYGTGVDVEICEVSVPSNAVTVRISGITTGTISSAEILSVSGVFTDLTELDSDRFVTLMIRARKKSANASAIGGIYGFSLLEVTSDAAFGGSSHSSGVIPTDNSRYVSSAPLDVALLRKMCRDIERLLQYRRRGCTIAFPMPTAPPMSSIHWRAHGPFPWLSAPWAAEADVVIRAGNFQTLIDPIDYDGTTSIGALSASQRRDAKEVRDVDDIVRENGGGDVDMSSVGSLGSQVKCVVPVRAGAWNDIFIAYRGRYFDSPFDFEYELTNTRFDDFNQGVIRSVVDGDFPLVEAEFISAIEEKLGRHVRLRSENNAWINSSGGGKPSSSPGGITRSSADVTADSSNTDTEFLFDITNWKGLHDGEYYNALSPAPPFILPSNPNDENLKIAVNRHGWLRLWGLYIGDRVKESDAYRFTRPGRPAPSSLAVNYLQMLNSFLDHPKMVYGVGCNNIGSFDAVGGSTTGAAAVFRGTTYPIIHSIGDLYEEPTDPVIHENVMTCPMFLPQEPGGERQRNPVSVRVRVEFVVFKAKDDNNVDSDGPRLKQPAVRLRFRPRFYETPPFFVAFSPAFNIGDWSEADVSELVRPHEDVDTMSLWDDWVNCTKAGWSEEDPSDPHRSVPPGSWPAELLSEKYPYDVYEFSVPMAGMIYYGDHWWLSVDVDFHSFQRLGSGASGTGSHGDGLYYLVIKGFSVVADEYPRETW
jgi:hypothetical protein